MNIITAWEYIATQNDAPTQCKDTAKDLLRQCKHAQTMSEQTAKRAGELREQAADASRNIMPTLKRELITGKKHTLVDLVAQQLKANDALHIANLEHQYADQLLHSMHHKLKTTLKANSDELLAWIATRRISDIHALNYTDHITRELEYVYEHLGIIWQPKWNEGLNLGTSIRLPLVFQAGWVKDAHASAAWVWQHIALGDVRKRNEHHYIAAYVDELPRIETPAQPTPTRHRFANS